MFGSPKRMPQEEQMPVLESIERAVVDVWRMHPEMTNYTALRVYEAAIAHYSARARQQTPKPINFTGLDAALFESVKSVCEASLTQMAKPSPGGDPASGAEEMVACLRKLRKSVEFWTKEGGRQGYLEFVAKYVK